MSPHVGARSHDRAEAAGTYASLGWPVVRIYTVSPDGSCTCGRKECTKPGKHPQAQHGFKSAVTTKSEVRGLQWDFSNIGIATGKEAGIWVLDVDSFAGGLASLEAMIEKFGPLPNTVEALTGGGGRHLYFRYPANIKIKNSASKVAQGIDVRSDGGGVVAPPSRHQSGQLYRWAPGRAPGEIEPAAAPQWLYESITSRVHPQAEAPNRGDLATTLDAYAQSALAGEIARVAQAKPGTRNTTLNAAAAALGSLVGAGLLLRPVVETALSGLAISVGLERQEVEATIRSGIEFGLTRPRNTDEILHRHEQGGKKPANTDAQAARRKRLRDTSAALEWLEAQGIGRAAAEYFGFGLDKPYFSEKSGLTYADALTAPLLRADGVPLSVMCKADIPGVTLNPRAPWWTASKECLTFFAKPQEKQDGVLVCDLPDLWRLWSVMQLDTRLQVIASPSFEQLPPEWADAAFWDSWSKIYVGTPANERGDGIAAEIHRLTGRLAHRCAPPSETWRDSLQVGDHDGALILEAALTAAPAMRIAISHEGERGPGRWAYHPLDIGRAFHNGCLYYPCETLERKREIDKNGNVSEVEARDTVVIRSDGQVLRAAVMPAPAGTPPERRVMRLSDGTLIDRMPKAPASPSWSWRSIQAWLQTKATGPSPVRPLSAILADVLEVLRRAVWLPYEEDYAVLALTATASFGQAIYQAVPLILVCGEHGSGKSAAGIAISRLALNGHVVGQVSAAAAVRFIDETRGLLVMDDLESIGARGKDRGSFTEIVQWLKVSYNRDTATKIWSDANQSYKVEKLNGFGIKVINNTSGADAILGSRMLRVQTRKMPQKIAEQRIGLLPISADKVQQLRDELHVWTFENVGLLVSTYQEICPSASERSEEIAAPLRVLAKICGDQTLSAQLEAALARTSRASVNPDEPSSVLKEAAAALVRQGYREIIPALVIMEMRRLVDSNYGQSSTTEIPEYQRPEWVGQMLRTLDIVNSGEPGRRKRHCGFNLRIYPISQHFLAEVLEDPEPPSQRDVMDFCQGCATCPYRSLDCPFLERRTEDDQHLWRGRPKANDRPRP